MSATKTVMDIYKEYVFMSRYAKFNPELGHRETDWAMAVDRILTCYYNKLDEYKKENPQVSESFIRFIKTELDICAKPMILAKEVLPSMRLVSMAGPAVERDNTCIYNCAYLPMDSYTAFVETLFILMNGTGVGFSVSKRYVNSDYWPKVPLFSSTERPYAYQIADSTEGWCDALKHLLDCLYDGVIPTFDFSLIRPAGTVLKTKGGRASGPEPLAKLFQFIIDVFHKAQGRCLNTAEVHDIVCMIADIVIVGGVRRSALISLGDLDDSLHASLKSGDWWKHSPWRANANNSAIVNSKMSWSSFEKEWDNLYESRSGERGLWHLPSVYNHLEKNTTRDLTIDYGCNPCSEIILRPRQFCNLTSWVVPKDMISTGNFHETEKRIRMATLLGIIQSLFDKFPYLESLGKSEWSDNAKDERLLGVSMNGLGEVFDLGGNKMIAATLYKCKDYIRKYADAICENLLINKSAAITCIKPEGTTSALSGITACGMHSAWSEYFIRHVKNDKKDPLAAMLIDQGVPHEQDINNESAVVFKFPIQSKAVTNGYQNPVTMLYRYIEAQDAYCEHKPSVTVNYREDDFLELGTAVWDQLRGDRLIGVSFFPYDDNVYVQAPFTTCTKEEYRKLLSEFPENVDFSLIKNYERADNTVSSFECTGPTCVYTGG